MDWYLLKLLELPIARFDVECGILAILKVGSPISDVRNFGGTCVSDKLRLGPSAGCEGLNHHDIDGNGGPDIGTSS